MSRQRVIAGVEDPICEWLSAHIPMSQLLTFLIAFSPLASVPQWVLDCSFFLLILDSRSRQGIQDRLLGTKHTHIFFSTTITNSFGLFSDRWTIARLAEQCKGIISVVVSAESVTVPPVLIYESQFIFLILKVMSDKERNPCLIPKTYKATKIFRSSCTAGNSSDSLWSILMREFLPSTAILPVIPGRNGKVHDLARPRKLFLPSRCILVSRYYFPTMSWFLTPFREICIFCDEAAHSTNVDKAESNPHQETQNAKQC